MGTIPLALAARRTYRLVVCKPLCLRAERNSLKFASRTVMLLKVSRRLNTDRSLSPACAFPLPAYLLADGECDELMLETDIFLLSEVDGLILPREPQAVCEQIHRTLQDKRSLLFSLVVPIALHTVNPT
jgi:hypothetical protein